MIQTPFTMPDLFARCPSCEEPFCIGDMTPGRSAGPWWCNKCGNGMRVDVISVSAVKVELTGEKTIETEVHLVLDELPELPLRLIVKGMDFGDASLTDEQIVAASGDHDRYFYEEHTCVVNYLRSAKEIITGDGDRDRHGIFRWEKTLPKSSEVEAEKQASRPPTLQEIA